MLRVMELESSLYHYLTSHPRVLPAKEKQIHYFKVRQRNICELHLVRNLILTVSGSSTSLHTPLNGTTIIFQLQRTSLRRER
jgi:hypothetical protein